MKTPPLKAVKDRFGDKQKLVSAVKALATDELWLGRVNDHKGLDSVSNAKLLRLHDTLSRVKKDFGSRAKLVDSILSLSKRDKDAGLRSSLEKFSTPRLIDLQTSAARRAKGAPEKAAPATPKKKKKARSKKAKAKAKAASVPAAKPAAKAKK
jgi:hypothetical protein